MVEHAWRVAWPKYNDVPSAVFAKPARQIGLLEIGINFERLS